MVVKAHELKVGDLLAYIQLTVTAVEVQTEQVIVDLEDGTFRAYKNDWNVVIIRERN